MKLPTSAPKLRNRKPTAAGTVEWVMATAVLVTIALVAVTAVKEDIVVYDDRNLDKQG